MHILYIVAYAPTVIRTRPYNILRVLAKRGHQVTLATLWENEAEHQALGELAKETGVRLLAYPLTRPRILLNLLQTLPTVIPLQARYSWCPKLASALEQEVIEHDYDVVQFEHLRGSAYGLHLLHFLKQAGKKVPLVYDSVDCISLIYQQAARKTRSKTWRGITRIELPRTEKYEARICKEFPRILVTSRKDRQALIRLARLNHEMSQIKDNLSDRISVIPNGVDTDKFSPTHNQEDKTIIFSGKMSYHANISAVKYLYEQIMPLVWREEPTCKLRIVGKDPPKNILAISEQDKRIEVIGWVPDLADYLAQATIAVAPIIYGAGIQNKVLEAMACGLPVVASSIAVSAINVTNWEECVIADQPDEYAKAVLTLMKDPHLRKAMGKRARSFVLKSHNWNKVGEMLEEIYEGEFVN